MEETLKTRSDGMQAALNRKPVESQDAFRKERLKELSGEEAIELLESHPVVMEKMKERLGAASAEETAKLESQIQGIFEEAKKQISDAEARKVLKSNALLCSIFKGNLKNRIEADKAKITAALTAEFDAKLRSAEDAAKSAKANAVLLEGNKSSLMLSMREERLQLANAKLGIAEKAVEKRPYFDRKDVGEKVKQWKPTIASIVAIPILSKLAAGQSTTPCRSLKKVDLGSESACSTTLIINEPREPWLRD